MKFKTKLIANNAPEMPYFLRANGERIWFYSGVYLMYWQFTFTTIIYSMVMGRDKFHILKTA